MKPTSLLPTWLAGLALCMDSQAQPIITTQPKPEKKSAMTNINLLRTSPSGPADTEHAGPFRKNRYCVASGSTGLTANGHKKHQAMTSFRCVLGVVALGFLWTGPTATAQSFTTLKNFGGITDASGSSPSCELVQGPDGTLYGTAAGSDGISGGTVFKMQPDGGGFTVLKSFTNPVEGTFPFAGLTLSGSVLYGTTVEGGTEDRGTVYRLNTDGSGYTVLKHFSASDGKSPYADLILSGSTLFGTTYEGGAFDLGTVFRVNTDGTGYALLKYFAGGASDGASPNGVLALSGNTLFGSTQSGGILENGTVFQVNTDGTGDTVLKHFTESDGISPFAGLTVSGGVLYGPTFLGGDFGMGTVFKMNTDGSGFTVLKHFTGSDGAIPAAVLAVSGSVLYGTTAHGGISENGTVFQVNTDGTGFRVLKRFAGGDGARPYAALTVSGSTLYGTTAEGGDLGLGTVFTINLSNSPEVTLNIQSLGNAVVLTWSNPAFAIQAAPFAGGSYTNIPGATSPYTKAIDAPQQFFRLIGN